MRAINGYFEDGRFMPNEIIKLPKRVQAVLVLNDMDIDVKQSEQFSWLKEFHAAIKSSMNEELPDYPRVSLNRELIDLSNEG